MNIRFIVFFALLIFTVNTYAASPEEAAAWWTKYFNSRQPFKELKNNQEVEVQKFIPQVIFDQFHPIGRAKSIKVHEVKLAWKNNTNTGNTDDLLSNTIRFTIYWEGVVVTDGYTQIEAVFDNEIGRFTSSRILKTNGMTNSEAGFLIGAGIGAAIESSAQK